MIIKTLITIFSLVFFCSIFTNCDSFYHIPLNGNTDTLKILTDCGKINVHMINWQGHAFDFYQDYILQDSLTINRDSIYALYSDSTYPLFFVGSNVSDSIQLTLSGKGILRTAFYIRNKKVNAGDTIYVIPKGYIYCKNTPFPLDTIKLIINENIRAPFEK